jgi:hypothetical protein
MILKGVLRKSTEIQPVCRISGRVKGGEKQEELVEIDDVIKNQNKDEGFE